MIGIATIVVLSVLGGVFGVCLHELAHFVGFRVCGLRASILRPSIDDGRLTPMTRFERGQSLGVRVGALAPVVAGLVLAPVFLFAAVSIGSRSVLAALTMCWIWTVKPSRQDLAVAMRG